MLALWFTIRWHQLRAWLHRRRYKPLAVVPGENGELLIECSCGGSTQLWCSSDGTMEPGFVTCPLYRWTDHVHLPQARALKGGEAW